MNHFDKEMFQHTFEIDYLTDEKFEEPQEFINYFLHHENFQTGNLDEASLPGKSGMIFRGQSDADWLLSPAAFREGSLNNFTYQPPIPIDQLKNQPIRDYLGFHLHAEAVAVSLFLKNADSAGISTPLDYTSINQGLDHIIKALNNKDYDYREQFPIEKLHRATALAQHHGVPTRFIDWSESPLVACYFAAFDASTFSPKPHRENQEIAVIFLSTRSLLNESSPILFIQAPRHENSHLKQQRGVFTLMKDANSFFLKKSRWPTLNDYHPKNIQLNRVKLPAKRADDLLRELFDLDITRLSLMPNLANAAGACKYMKALFSK